MKRSPYKRRVWNSSRTQTDTHSVKGVNQMWFKSKTDAEKYKAWRRLQERAKRAGYPTTEEGVLAFKAWEDNRKPVILSNKHKVEKIKRMIDRDDQSMADFAHAVINIIEDR